MDQEYIKLQQEGSDWSFGSRWGDQMEEAITGWFAADIADKTSPILDAACGEGRGLLALKNLGFSDVTGVDLATDKLDKAKERGLNVFYADMHELPFEDNKFEYCFSSHTLEHMHDLKKAITELLRVSKKLYYIIPVYETEEFVKNNNPSHVHPINNPKEFIKILTDLGLRHNSYIKHRMSTELWGVIEK